MRNAQASASAVTHAEAWTACAWDLLPESKIRTNPQTAVPYAVAYLLTFSVRIQLVIFVTFTRILPDPIDLESASAFLLPLSP